MGKTNKGQRTKGNTRPSSSVQSALLLNASGRSFGGFVGFESLEKDPVYVPVTGQPDESGVDSDFRMAMRKMIKKDSLTRLKVGSLGERSSLSRTQYRIGIAGCCLCDL
ncbi:E3 ubiquitin-protein ligase listerin-like [Uloborus diversus]|uniref:E3 ubiquitin-protein ligase listerin-like n=1 Tax=Uloborus diversus TaxID=327109 RepID=UPI002409673A|nr:E3 ubiquitin-protein ligase listerin-like [Uloborus diversus]